MTFEYNYDDPEQLWPCLGAMTTEELDAEWLRCWKLLYAGDPIIKRPDHRLSDRLRNIERERLSCEFVVENNDRFIRGEIAPTGSEFERWCYMKFMQGAR